MIVAFWNMREFNDPLKSKEVKCFLNVNNIYVCGLFETRVKESHWHTKSSDLGSK